MKKFAITNINIDYDEIQDEWRTLSKSQIKKAVYDYVYGCLSNDYRQALNDANVQINAYWHYGWDAPVVQIPPVKNYLDILDDITEDLKRQFKPARSKSMDISQLIIFQEEGGE